MSITPKIPVKQARTSTPARAWKGKGGARNAKPSHTVFVPDIENPGKLTRVGVMFRFQSGKYKGTGYSVSIDDDPRAKQLAYENFERLVILPDRN